MTTQQLNRLSARKVATLDAPGRHADGGGLYLSISKDGQRRRWVFLFRWQGRLREMGLSIPCDVPLARAREAAVRVRDLVAQGTDPLAVRQAKPAVPTFGIVADAFVEAMKAQWRNEKHVAQWQMTLWEYAAPLRDRPVDGISTDDVMRVLKPIWLQKPETASRLCGRIERVLDAAKAQNDPSLISRTRGLARVLLGLLGGDAAESRMDVLPIVIAFDVGEQVAASLVPVRPSSSLYEFDLEGVEDPFHGSVVVTSARPAHGRRRLHVGELFAIGLGGVLAPRSE